MATDWARINIPQQVLDRINEYVKKGWIIHPNANQFVSGVIIAELARIEKYRMETEQDP